MADANVSATGVPPSEEANKLLKRSQRFQGQVAVLAEQRQISRQFMREAIGEFDPENISLFRMYQMRKDPMLQMGLHYCKFPLVRSKWHIECEDEKIGQAIEEMIRPVHAAYTKMFLNKLDFGYQGGIKQYELGSIDGQYEDKKTGVVSPLWDDPDIQPLVLGSPLPLPPEWVRVRLEEGAFAGIDTLFGSMSEQSTDSDEDRFIPAEHAVWTTNEFEEHFRNYYGYPRTGYAYRFWWSYWFRFHMEDRHFEQDADPALQVWYPPGDQAIAGQTERKSNQQVALEMGANLRGGATVAWPSEVYHDDQGKATTTRLWEAAFLTGGENLQAFRASAEYLDILRLRSILVPEQALVEGKGGTDSRASSLSYASIFNESLGQEAEDQDGYWNRYIIPKLVEANFGTDAPRCTKKTTGFEDEDLTLAGELIKIAFQLDPNALPIDFEELVTMANLPILSVKEQKERAEEVQQMKAEADAKRQEEMAAMAEANPQGAPGAPGLPPRRPGGPPQMQPPARQRGAQLSAEQTAQADIAVARARAAGGEGAPPSLHLHQGGKRIESTAPDWARREHDRRERSIAAMTDRLEGVVEDYFRGLTEAAAQYIEQSASGQQELSLAIRDRKRVKAARQFFSGMLSFARDKLRPTRDRVQAEMASMYHASGATELMRLGQSLTGWDVEREDIQAWAERVGRELIEGSDEQSGIGENYIKLTIQPWIEDHYKGGSYQFDPDEANALADQLRMAMADKPGWMAKRVARSEARKTMNNASADVWDQSGIERVRLYDGLGGLSGMTDEECLSRNGKIVTVGEFRREDAKEHPNGTLGAVPVIDETVAIIKLSQSPPRRSALRSDSIYVVQDGLILSQEQVGAALANG